MERNESKQCQTHVVERWKWAVETIEKVGGSPGKKGRTKKRTPSKSIVQLVLLQRSTCWRDRSEKEGGREQKRYSQSSRERSIKEGRWLTGQAGSCVLNRPRR